MDERMPLTPEVPVRVGLIGFGLAGSTFHAPLIDYVAVSNSRMNVVTSRTDEVLLERPEALSIRREAAFTGYKEKRAVEVVSIG